MKLDRFWITQILIIAALFAILIGSYLFSFGWFAQKPRLLNLPHQRQQSPPLHRQHRNR